MIDPRLPVIIGVGQSEDRTEDLSAAKGAGVLMLEALQSANSEAGGRAFDELDTLELVRLFSAPMDHIPAQLAAGIPTLRSKPVFRVGHGNTPLLLLSEAAARIRAGKAELCAIAGAEAYRTEKRMVERANGGARPDMMRRTLQSVTSDVGRSYGIVTPIEIYPLFENAMRAAWGQSLEQAQQESAALWSSFSEVAAGNPHAWIQRRYSTEEILDINPANRKQSFPYSTLMVANNSVNQGAAIILASYAKAKRLGIPDDKLTFVGAGAAAKESHDFLQRRDYFSSPSISAVLKGVLDRNGIEASQCDYLELYSCFPCVPKYVRRQHAFRPDVPMTVIGGLTFAGGPIRNYMMHATAAMAQKLRLGGKFGLLFGNGGYMTEAHAVVLASQPIAGAQHSDFDVQQEADRLRGAIPVTDPDYEGTGVIETYTVPYGRDGIPMSGAIVGRSDDGVRFVCHAERDDRELMSLLTSGAREPIGRWGRVVRRGDRRIWLVT